MTSSSPPVQVVVGPAHHGVVDYADDLADAVARNQPSTKVLRLDDATRLEALARDLGRIHLHVTDGLFGVTLADAATSVSDVCRTVPTSLTLHDVPQPSDGANNLGRRSAAYRRMIEDAVGVAVSSEHEQRLLRDYVDPLLDTAVVPLGTRFSAAPAPRPSGRDRCVVLMAGYLYPGKGHDDVIRAAACFSQRSGLDVEVVSVGGISPGHADLATQLHSFARDEGVRFSITGRLSSADYRERFQRGGIPVVAHRHYSASRSLLDWAEAGRRPIVVETDYTREMAALRPGTLCLTAGQSSAVIVAALSEALEAAHQDPAGTYLEAGHPIGPSLDDAAGDYLAWWSTLPW